MSAVGNRSRIRLAFSKRTPIEICLSSTIVNRSIHKRAVSIN